MKIKISLLCIIGLALIAGCDQENESAVWKVFKSFSSEKTEVRKSDEPLPAITNGISEAAFKKIFGEPIGSVARGGTRILLYHDFKVTLKNGTIVDIPNVVNEIYAKQTGPSALEKFKKATQRIATPQESKDDLARMAAYTIYNSKNELIDHSSLASSGKITVVEFSAEQNAACEAVHDGLKKMFSENDTVEIRTVNIDSWNSDVAKQYHITTVPDVRVLDVYGYLVSQPITRIELVEDHIDLGRVKDAVAKARKH